MCNQILNTHTCTHLTHGSLTTCSTPLAPAHQRSTSYTPYPTPCPSCRTGQSASISNAPTSILTAIPSVPPPPYVTVLPASIPPPPYASVAQQQTIFYSLPPQAPTYFPQPTPTIYFLPLPSAPHKQPQFFPFQPLPPTSQIPPWTPGAVPSWVPRQIRYELIRGVITPIEHFPGPSTPLGAFNDPFNGGGRSWNTFHGYDTGPSPPYLEPGNGGWVGRGWNPVHGCDNGPVPPGFGFGAGAGSGGGSGSGDMPDLGRELRNVAVSSAAEASAVEGSGGSSDPVEGASIAEVSGARIDGNADLGLGASGAGCGREGITTALAETETTPEDSETGGNSLRSAGRRLSWTISRSQMERKLNAAEAVDRE